MPQIVKSALVNFPAARMYQLVNEVENYPQFIDGCDGAEILESSEHLMVARLFVTKSGFSQAFTTRNQLILNEQISMDLVDGPFEYLRGTWRFISLDDSASKIEFDLDFKFKNALLGMAFGKAFQQLAENMVQSFIQQAKKIQATESC